MSIETRLQKLEKARGIGEPTMAVIITEPNETMEQAKTRYYSQHPQAAHAAVKVFMDLGCDE